MEEELINHLKEKKIAGAALDVFETEPLPPQHPIWQLENLIISPHNAYFSPNTLERYMDLFLKISSASKKAKNF